jgi:hypothetical protein
MDVVTHSRITMTTRFLFGLATLSLFAGSAVRGGELVELPPFLVEAASRAPHWRYLKTPEYEVLSQCSDDVTRAITETQHALYARLTQLLPNAGEECLRFPRILIIYDEARLPRSQREGLALIDGPNSSTLIREPARGSTTERYLKSPSLFDGERVAVFISVAAPPEHAIEAVDLTQGFATVTQRDGDSEPNSARFGTGWTALTPGFVGQLLSHASPPLPNWFTAGFMSTYRQSTFQEGVVMIRPFEWAHRGVTEALRSGHDAHLALADLASVLTEPRPATVDIETWLSEAELFVRWGLTTSNRARFLPFVARCSREPLDESLFRSCFGTGFAGVQEQLQEFARSAVRQSAILDGLQVTPLGKLRLRNATVSEIGTLKGSAERIETNYVRGTQPNFETDYLMEVRRTFHRAYDKGIRDPELLAEMGLCEAEAGSAETARAYLTEAVKNHVARPRVFVELARLGLNGPQRTPAAGQPTETLKDHPLALLRQAVQLEPPLKDAFDLFADALTKGGTTSEPTDLDLVARGMELFANNPVFVEKVARLLAEHGDRSQAARGIARALDYAMADDDRIRLLELSRQIMAGPPSPK